MRHFVKGGIICQIVYGLYYCFSLVVGAVATQVVGAVAEALQTHKPTTAVVGLMSQLATTALVAATIAVAAEITAVAVAVATVCG